MTAAHVLGRIILMVSITSQWLLGIGQPVQPAHAQAFTQSDTRLKSLLIIDDLETLQVGQKPVIHMRLLNAINHRFIPNKVLIVYLNDRPLRQIRTDKMGKAAVKVTQELTAGSYVIRAVFGGTQAYDGTSAVKPFTVRPVMLRVQTIPSLPGMLFKLDGKPFVSAADGIASIEVARLGTYTLEAILPEDATANPDERIRFKRWGDDRFETARQVKITADKTLQVGYELFHPVGLSFVDPNGVEVKQERIDTLTLKSSFGMQYTLVDGLPQMLQANRIVRRQTGLEATPVAYTVENVIIDGTNAVNQPQQRYLVKPGDEWQVALQLYYARIEAKDILFGIPVGDGITIEYPNGRQETHSFRQEHNLTLGPLARGRYLLQVIGAGGITLPAPVVLSQDQLVELKVLTGLDIAVVTGLGIALALALLLYSRPHRLNSLPRRR